MSDIVNKALADLLAGHHELSKTVHELSSNVRKLNGTVHKLADQSDHQVVLIQALLDAQQLQAENSVPLRQDVAELKERVAALERRVS